MASTLAWPRFPVRRVLARIKDGSSLPVIVDTPGGRFVTKLRGAAQGPSALVAEVIVAELAERLGLPVPARAIIELNHPIHTDDHNDELADLLDRSVGQNLGFRWLAGARVVGPADALRLEDDFAVRVLWLDALVMNPDRTPGNPNVLLSRGQPWLIDHGAALGFQHDWGRVDEGSPKAPSDHRSHLFAERQHLLAAWDAPLAAVLSREALGAVVERVPDSFLAARPAEWTLARTRAAYAAFLWKRLGPPRPFLLQG